MLPITSANTHTVVIVREAIEKLKYNIPEVIFFTKKIGWLNILKKKDTKTNLFDSHYASPYFKAQHLKYTKP